MTGAIHSSSTAATDRSVAIGIALVLSSAVAWSTAGFFARMVPLDIWIVVFWRGVFGGLSIAVLAMIERRRFGFDFKRAFSLAGIALILISATGKIAFLYALQNTTVANVTVLYATLPFMTAILAWLWFREKAERRTLIGSLVAGVGVIITVGGSTGLGGGHILGDLAALFMTLTMALMTVIMRRHREVPMLEAAALSGIFAAMVAFPMADPFTATLTEIGWLALFGIVTQGGGLGIYTMGARRLPMLEAAALSGILAALIAFPMADPFTATLTEIGWLALFGIVTQGGGLGIYTMGARRLPSAQAALLSASEVPMSPLWVWIFFQEVPAQETFIGGGLVLAAILWNIGAELRKSTKAKAAQ